MIRVADYIIQRIYDEGVKHIFSVTGRGLLFLTDAVAAHKDIQNISMHHEQAASFAAMAYAQANEKIGACLVSTGCASTNAITGLLCAWQDDVPTIFISGQNKLEQTTNYTKVTLKTYGQQETDIVKIVKPITKYAIMIKDPKNIAYEIDKAFYLAQNGRKGPVWIDVPLDIQNMRIDPEKLERYDPENNLNPKPKKNDIEYIIKAINNAKRPTILIGSGVRSSFSIKELEKFVDKTNIPVTYANSAVDAYPSEKRLSIGAVGSLGANRAGNFAVQNSDLLLVIGCRLSTFTTGDEYEKFARQSKVIVVDIDKAEHSKNTIKIDKFILSDAKEFLTEMLKQNLKQINKKWIDKCLHWKKTFPKCEDKYKQKEKIDLYYLGEILTNTLKSKSALIVDAGLTELLLPTTIEFKKTQRCIHTPSQGSMGYALPAAIGAYYSFGEEIVAAIGDGSIMMNIQELQTISHYKIPIKIIITNNNVYSVIRKRQTQLFRKRTIGTDASNGVSCPDFKKVSESFNIPYIKITKNDKFDQDLKLALEKDGPIIIEIICVEDQEYLHNSYTHNKEGKFVKRGIEDQSPFLDRDTFLKEMVIKPIDQ